MKMMKYAAVTDLKQAEVFERPVPKMGENDLLVKLYACNICTADYGVWTGSRKKQFPVAGGHENIGIIIDKGDKVNSEFNIGDCVGFSIPFCGLCEECRNGNTIQCEHILDAIKPTEDGVSGFIGFAEYKVVNARIAVKVDPSLPFEESCFLEPLATVVHGLKKVRPTRFDNVVVIGAGTMGLLNAQVYRFYGSNVIITEMMQKKIDVAMSLGFDVIDISKDDPVEKVNLLTEGKGADLVICAASTTSANKQAIKMLKKDNGKVLFFAAGYPAPELDIDSNQIHYRAMELIGTYDATISDFMEASKILAKREINLKCLLENSFSLSEIQKAFECAATPGAYRVTVRL